MRLKAAFTLLPLSPYLFLQSLVGLYIGTARGCFGDLWTLPFRYDLAYQWKPLEDGAETLTLWGKEGLPLTPFCYLLLP